MDKNSYTYCENIEEKELYKPRFNGSHLHISTSTFSAVFFAVALPLTSLDIAIETTEYESFKFEYIKPNIRLNQVSLKGAFSLYKPKPKGTTLERRNYSAFLSSFCSRVSNIYDQNKLRPLFDLIANNLNKLNIQKSIIDASPSREQIKFILDLGDELTTTVFTDSNMAIDGAVEFTVSYKKKLLIANMMEIKQLRDTLLKIQREINLV